MRAIIAVVVLALLVTTGAAAIDASVEEGAKQVTVDDETFTPSTSSYTTLNESNRDAVRYFEKSNLVVEDENGTRVDRTDYNWNATNGTIQAVPGGALDGDASATIDYGYYRVPAFGEGMGTSYGYILNALTVLTMIVAVGVILAGVRVLIS